MTCLFVASNCACDPGAVVEDTEFRTGVVLGALVEQDLDSHVLLADPEILVVEELPGDADEEGQDKRAGVGEVSGPRI